MPEGEGIDTCGVWMVRCRLEKGGTNLVPLSVHSRPVEIAFLLHCQTLSHLSFYQCCDYMHTLFSSYHGSF